ncbi:Uncharacterised protein [Citrobacter koseri]|uniref:Uncharacterized protein n=1 Tax=Citrobacter koseri TaxID=545 RepID=A0A2X2YER4_CITKO|nr:Uncharacterised protein [Citrobacter koseri]
MANKKTAPAKEKKVTDKDYFDEAKSWDESEIVREKKSARRAWSAFWAMTGVVHCSGDCNFYNDASKNN